MIFLILLVSIFTVPSYAQFFDQDGVFLEDVIYPNDERVGWVLSDENMNTTVKSNVALGMSASPEDYFCSGTVFKPVSRPRSSKALVFSNGHCTPYLNDFVKMPRLQIINQAVPETWSNFGIVLNNFFNSTRSREHVLISRILYSSMYKRDIAVLEMKMTYDELLAEYGIKPSLLSLEKPKIDEGIFSVGTPMAFLPLEVFYNHTSYCKHLGEAKLIEGPIETDIAIKNNCSLNAGQSGSGLFKEDGSLYAIQITGYDKAATDAQDCDIGKPCEILGNDRAANHTVSYGVYVYDLNQCFGAEGVFDPTAEGCWILND